MGKREASKEIYKSKKFEVIKTRAENNNKRQELNQLFLKKLGKIWILEKITKVVIINIQKLIESITRPEENKRGWKVFI